MHTLFEQYELHIAEKDSDGQGLSRKRKKEEKEVFMKEKAETFWEIILAAPTKEAGLSRIDEQFKEFQKEREKNPMFTNLYKDLYKAIEKAGKEKLHILVERAKEWEEKL